MVLTAANMWTQETGKKQRQTDAQMDNIIYCLQPPPSGLSFPSCTGEDPPLPSGFEFSGYPWSDPKGQRQERSGALGSRGQRGQGSWQPGSARAQDRPGLSQRAAFSPCLWQAQCPAWHPSGLAGAQLPSQMVRAPGSRTKILKQPPGTSGHLALWCGV